MYLTFLTNSFKMKWWISRSLLRHAILRMRRTSSSVKTTSVFSMRCFAMLVPMWRKYLFASQIRDLRYVWCESLTCCANQRFTLRVGRKPEVYATTCGAKLRFALRVGQVFDLRRKPEVCVTRGASLRLTAQTRGLRYVWGKSLTCGTNQRFGLRVGRKPEVYATTCGAKLRFALRVGQVFDLRRKSEICATFEL